MKVNGGRLDVWERSRHHTIGRRSTGWSLVRKVSQWEFVGESYVGESWVAESRSDESRLGGKKILV